MLKEILCVTCVFALLLFSNSSYSDSVINLGGCNIAIPIGFEKKTAADIWFQNVDLGSDVIYLREEESRPLSLYFNESRFQLVYSKKSGRLEFYFFEFDYADRLRPGYKQEIGIIKISSDYLELLGMELELVKKLAQKIETDCINEIQE